MVGQDHGLFAVAGITMQVRRIRGDPGGDHHAGRKSKKLYETMFHPNDYMIAVRWYELVPGLEDQLIYEAGLPEIVVINSSELRLAAFSMEQVKGPRPINMRPRRCGAAEEMEQVQAQQRWCLPFETYQEALEACVG